MRQAATIFCLLTFALRCWADDKPKPEAKERAAVEAAIKTYDQEIAAAGLAHKAAIGRAEKKLLAAYDFAIASAMKRGGGDALDFANKLNDEKKLRSVLVESNDLAVESSPKQFDILGEWNVKANIVDQKFTFINGPRSNTIYRIYVGPDFPQGVKQGPYLMKRVRQNVVEVYFTTYTERFTFFDENTFFCEDIGEAGRVVYGGVGRRVTKLVDPK